MKKEVTPYEQALDLKELGFNEDCIYHYKKIENKHSSIPTFEMLSPFGKNHNLVSSRVSAPLYQQAFRFFREKYGLYHYITTYDATDFEWYIHDKNNPKDDDFEDITTQDAYEEAELECLKKLIEIVKLKNKSDELHISDVSCSIEDIKKWVNDEIGYYDECETVEDAIDDMLHDFKTHFLNIDYTIKFDKETELVEYFKSEWKQYYN